VNDGLLAGSDGTFEASCCVINQSGGSSLNVIGFGDYICANASWTCLGVSHCMCMSPLLLKMQNQSLVISFCSGRMEFMD
jgi:hypothetical protein